MMFLGLMNLQINILGALSIVIFALITWNRVVNQQLLVMKGNTDKKYISRKKSGLFSLYLAINAMAVWVGFLFKMFNHYENYLWIVVIGGPLIAYMYYFSAQNLLQEDQKQMHDPSTRD